MFLRWFSSAARLAIFYEAVDGWSYMGPIETTPWIVIFSSCFRMLNSNRQLTMYSTARQRASSTTACNNPSRGAYQHIGLFLFIVYRETVSFTTYSACRHKMSVHWQSISSLSVGIVWIVEWMQLAVMRVVDLQPIMQQSKFVLVVASPRLFFLELHWGLEFIEEPDDSSSR